MTTRRAHRLLAGALLAGALLPLHVSAQLCVQDNKLGVSVNPALITFSTPTFVHFDNGSILYQTTVTLNVTSDKGNKQWTLCVASQQPDLGTSGGVTKSIGDLQFQAPGGAWLPVSLAPQVLYQDRGSVPVQVNLRMVLSWMTDGPGDFGTVLQFTVN